MITKLLAYLDEGRGIAGQATQGPWHQVGQDKNEIIQTKHVTRDVWNIARCQHGNGLAEFRPGEQDARFISDARTRVEIYEQIIRKLAHSLDLARGVMEYCYTRDAAIKQSDISRIHETFAKIGDVVSNEACEALARVEQLVPGGCERSEAFPAGSAITEDDLKP